MSARRKARAGEILHAQVHPRPYLIQWERLLRWRNRTEASMKSGRRTLRLSDSPVREHLSDARLACGGSQWVTTRCSPASDYIESGTEVLDVDGLHSPAQPHVAVAIQQLSSRIRRCET
jgi:hypothetical protein